MIVCVWFFGWSRLGSLGLLLADTVHTGARVDVIVDRPVGALPSVGEGAGDFLEAWIER